MGGTIGTWPKVIAYGCWNLYLHRSPPSLWNPNSKSVTFPANQWRCGQEGSIEGAELLNPRYPWSGWKLVQILGAKEKRY